MGRSREYYEYINSETWKSKSKHCQSLTGNRCVMFPWLRSRSSHHLTYDNFKRELPLRDIVPLSGFAHWMVHIPIFWGANRKASPFRLPINVLLRVLFVPVALLGVLLPTKKTKSRKRKKRK